MNDCIFCSQLLPEQTLAETEHFKVLLDINPVQSGHLLITSKAHFMDIRELNSEQLLDLIQFEQLLISKIYGIFTVDGVTIIENNGNIMEKGTHFHVHLVPRFQNDQFWDNQTVIQHKNDLKKLKAHLKEKI